MADPGPARVFLSCGQNAETDERKVAEAIAATLRDAGFDPYVGVQEQSLRGLKENIFAQLSSSEYFLFVDFKREKLGTTASAEHRGSLFYNQELAIASYLDIPVLAFQEKGVKELDGVLGFLQGNCIPFTDRNTLHAVVAREIQKQERNWRPDWRSLLSLERGEPSKALTHLGARQLARWYPVHVKNLHREKTARNCTVYLNKTVCCSSHEERRPRTVELKWTGYRYPSVSIAAGTNRPFDGFYVLEREPPVLNFAFFTDSDEYRFHVQGPGEFVLEYTVLSDNFPAATSEFLVTIGRRWDEITWVKRDA